MNPQEAYFKGAVCGRQNRKKEKFRKFTQKTKCNVIKQNTIRNLNFPWINTVDLNLKSEKICTMGHFRLGDAIQYHFGRNLVLKWWTIIIQSAMPLIATFFWK